MSSGYLQVFVALVALTSTLHAGSPRAEFDAHVGSSIAKLNREATTVEGALRLASLVQSEYGSPIQELRWAVEQKIPWGEIVALAYIQATNGRTFSELGGAAARSDFWSYLEKAGMSSDKMARSLEQFLKNAERERNSTIFAQLRSARRVPQMPDLGSGFGLFQEALDFRKIDPTPGPIKIHTVGSGVLAKGEQ